MSSPSSRYANTPEATLAGPDGGELRYKLTRFIPDTPAVRGHLLVGGERLDHIAFRHYRAPELYWRICDANTVLDPADLEQSPGRKIDIPEAT